MKKKKTATIFCIVYLYSASEIYNCFIRASSWN